MTDEQKRQEMLKHLQALRPIDDEFMRCMFKDNIPLVQFVLRIITGKHDLIITECQTQKDLKRLAGSRSVCLDVHGKDGRGTEYNLEIEKNDKETDPHRARYHSSVLDVEALNAGQEFKDLPETYVIFLTEHDVFGEGNAVYPIERMNLATGKPFADGEHILYVNGAYRGDSDIGKLMHDFCCANPDEMHFPLMAEKTRYLKETQKGVSEVSRIVEDILIQERREMTIEFALRLLNEGDLSVERISRVSGLSIEEVKALQTGRSA